VIFTVAVVLAAASAVSHAVTGQWEAAFRFAVVTVLMVAPWAADVPAPFAGAFAAFLLLATWASVQHWYREIPHFDTLVHLLTPGSLAAAAYYAFVHWRLMPAVSDLHRTLRSWSPVLWVTLVGVTAAVVWEFYEWVIEQISPQGMEVGYTDTVIDLFAGMTGSIVAGLFVLQWGRHHPAPRSTAPGRDAASALPS
jgi:hypothetical protein